MAIIGKIREKSVLVLVIVGLSLALFILGDFLGSPRYGGAESIGEIYGEPIDPMEYEQLVREEIEMQRMQLDRMRQEREMQGLPTDDLGDINEDEIREAVWNQLIARTISDREMAHFNFAVGSDELNDMMYGENLHPSIANKRAFQNPYTGEFVRDSLTKYLTLVVERDPEAKKQWRRFELELKKNREAAKFTRLITQGVYVTTSEAKKNFEDNNRIYRVNFVVKKFFDLPDSLVTVTDSDLRAYYEKNKFRKQYQQPGSRVFEYIEIPLVPSEEDRQKTYEDLEALKEPFLTTKNDSLFVMQYSENKFYNPYRYSTDNEFPVEADSLINAADSGQVIGPFLHMGYYRLVKVLGVKTEPEVRVRHILLPSESGTTAQLKARADSLRRVIKRDDNFAEMVTQYSTDYGSVANGGVYEWFTEGRMVKNFNDACFNGKVGDMPIVETEFGVHLIEILGQRKAKRLRYVSVDVEIRPLQETEQLAREKAHELLDAITDASKFREVAESQNYNVFQEEIFPRQREINQDPLSRELVRWVQTGMKDEVSDVFIAGNRVIVARISKVKQKGVPEFEDIKEFLRPAVRNEKKAEYLTQQMSNASSLQEIGQRVSSPVLSADLKFASTTIVGGGGDEPKVIGTVFSLTKEQQGSITIPIAGTVGVYVVQLQEIVEPAQTTDYSTNKQTLTRVLRNRSGDDSFRALKEKAKVIDNRQFF